MGNFTLNRGDLNTLSLTVLGLSGSPLAFPTDYTTPQVRVSHINGGSEVIDQDFIDMIQVSSTNRWYFKYNVPADAPFTNYLVTYQSTIEGVNTESTDEFRVIPPFAGEAGSGEFAVDFYVENQITHLPIMGADIRVADQSNPNIVIALARTDITGTGIVYLNAGNYIVEFSKTGEISETHNLVVHGNGSSDVDGD